MPKEASKTVTIALAGNPNSGKTTIFNSLTGARQHVGNYPGVTVEKKEGEVRHAGWRIKVVDLPGTYSLTAYSLEETVARDFVLRDSPQMVVDVVDESNLERNLYLAVQFMEMGVPLVLDFNMSDVATRMGYQVDVEKLSALLGVPIVKTVGHKGEGVRELLDAIVRVAEGELSATPAEIHYGAEIEEEMRKLVPLLEQMDKLPMPASPRWTALKLIEGDDRVVESVKAAADGQKVLEASRASVSHLQSIFKDAPEIVVADRRYGFISGACQECTRNTVEARHSMSDKIDEVLINRILGLPIFLALMYIVFNLTFTLGAHPMGWIETFFGWLAEAINSLWAPGAESALKSLLIDGVIGGVGGVVVFLPNIMLLFLAIALLEDSGYMARAAFIMDQFMHKIGLHGKSFIPMLIGFGCSIPAIMATRTLENRRDRLTTMLIVPLMSCGARLPIYSLIIPAFFPAKLHGPMLWLIYLIGIILAIISAKLLRLTIFRGESTPFVMELPPYRLPTLRGTLTHMWERSWLYLKKAGTVILGISVVLWAATAYPKPDSYSMDYESLMPRAEEELAAQETALPAELTAALEAGQIEDETELPQAYRDAAERLHSLRNGKASEEMTRSAAGRVGHAMEPLLRPLGFDWKIGTALIGALAAKEVFVAQLGIVYSVGEADESSEALRDKLQAVYTPLVGFCIMLFCLISAPCMATVAVTFRESGSWKWALLQVGGLTCMAYVITLVVYQVGRLLGIGV